MLLKDFKLEDLGLKQENLYEIIATTISKNKNIKEFKPNTSCMGIRLIENNVIKIIPYPNTTTFKNLKENGLITLNFVDDVYLFALAALKSPDSSIDLKEFPLKYYTNKDFQLKEFDFNQISMPFIKKAWAVLICKIIEENQIIKQDDFGEVKLTEFKLEIMHSELLKQSYKLFNRAENLVLEIILLATRLKLSKELENHSLFNKINELLNNHIENIKRFGKNRRALKTVDLVSKYVKILMI